MTADLGDGAPRGGTPAVRPAHGVVTLAPGRLYALPAPYALDGRVSTHPRDARGYASMNCYLLIEGESALLIDTGLSVHGDLLLAQLESLLTPDTELSIWPTRLGEFNAICNVRAVIERFGARLLYGNLANPGRWVDFRPEFTAYGKAVGGGALRDVETRVVRRDDTITVDPDGRRSLRVLHAPLRLLPTYWIHDAATRTLLTSDAFAYTSRETPQGPWTIAGAEDDPTTPASLRDCLVRGRFWWLPGADSASLRTSIDDVFDRHAVETIAPAFGCVLQGASVVRRHRELLDRVLQELGEQPAVGQSVALGPLGERPA